MKFKKIIIISSAALVLGACGKEPASSSVESSITPGSITKPTASFDKALAKDYSNCTILSYQSYYDGESSETDYEYIADGLICDYSWDLAQSGYDMESCLSYYHIDEKGESWTFWEAEKGTPNSKGGWLQKGYHNSDLSFWKAYFYLPNLLNNITAADVAMSQGVYYIKSNEKIKELNNTAFGYAWFNDIIDIAMIVNDDGYISHIFGFCDEDDNGDPKNYVEIILDDFGTTTVPYAAKVAEFGDDSKTTYWQYKGWPHDYEDAYYTDLHAKVSDSTPVTADAVHDVIAEVDDRWVVEALLTPTTFQPWDLVLEENANVTWHYDPKVVSLEYAHGDKAMNVHAIAPGETEIYATVKGQNKALESEHIKVKVNVPPTQDKSNAIFDFEWVAITPVADSEYGDVLAGNAVNTNAPYTIKAGPGAQILDGKNSDQYDAGKLYMVINPSDQNVLNKEAKPGLYFDFGEQQVSKLSFNYGFFYESHKLNVNNISEVKIRTSNDGVTYNEIDITEQIKTKASGEFSKLIEVEFPAATKVEIVMKASMIGKQCGITFDSLCFSKDETCSNWQDPSTVVPVTSITAAPSTADLYTGDTQVLHALVAPNNATDKSLTWHVEEGKEGIVSVSADGVVTALSAGTATVWATASNGVKSNEVTITVTDMPTLGDYVGNCYVGESVTAEILSANSAKVTFSGHEITATISGVKNDKILLSNTDGECFSLEFSHSTIFVCDIKYLENGTLKSPLRSSFDATLQVYMTSFNVKVGSLTPNASGKYEVLVGDTTYLSLSSFAPTNANVTSVTYSSSDKTIATVAGQDAEYDEEEGITTGAYGTVRFLKAGEVTITVASKKDPSIKKEIKFVVKDNIYPNDTNWSITPSATTVDQTAKVTFTTSFDSSITTDKTITWSVNNKVNPSKPTNATINTKTGELNVGTVAGTIEVTASVKGANGETVSKTVSITVKDAPAGSVVAAEAVGTWRGADGYDTSFTFVVNANGKAVFTIGGSSYNFTFVKVQSGVYTFSYDSNSDVTIDLDMSYLGGKGFMLNDDGGIINDYADVCFYDMVDVSK